MTEHAYLLTHGFEQTCFPLLLKLVRIECEVAPLRLDQLAVRPAFHDLTFFDDKDLIRHPDRRQPMRNDKANATMEDRLQPPLDQLLSLGVDGGGGLVHDEDTGICQ